MYKIITPVLCIVSLFFFVNCEIPPVPADDISAIEIYQDLGVSRITAEVNTAPGSLIPNYDELDIYVPIEGGNSPVLFLHSGAQVDKKYYSLLGKGLAGAGILFAVSNHRSILGKNYTEQIVLNKVWGYLLEKSGDPESPLYGKIDRDSLFVMGHSFGGVSVFNESQGKCMIPVCLGFLKPPAQLKASIIFGSNTEEIMGPIDNTMPFLYFQGENNNLDKALDTYARIKNDPKMFITVKGANHYGITDVNNPEGAKPVDEESLTDQETSIGAIVHWLTVFIDATMINGAGAIPWIMENENLIDERVEILRSYQ